MNYYNDLWTKENQHGTKFFRTVNFDTFPYQYQEKVFREYISNNLSGIKSVLELGVGTGRMLRIVTDELHPPIYDGVDIRMDSRIKPMLNNWYQVDITSKEFDFIFAGKWGEYDLILASEVLMHIKPNDIENVIKKLSKIGKQIINIDWNFDYAKSEWCFIHDYDSLYKKYGGKMVDRKDMKNIQQSLFHYRFGGA